jgi:hypothetical protein
VIEGRRSRGALTPAVAPPWGRSRGNRRCRRWTSTHQ